MVGIARSFHNLTSLTTLEFQNILGLRSLDEVFVQFPFGLKYLKISSCNELDRLWVSTTTVQKLVRLHHLKIFICSQLQSLQELCVLPMLGRLTLRSCNAVESLPCLSRLEWLELNKCPSLRLMPIHKLSSRIRILKIMSCEKLNLVSDSTIAATLTSITDLTLHGGPYFSFETYISANLRSLSIGDCDCPEFLPNPNLETLSMSFCRNIDILLPGIGISLWECSSVILFPQGDLPPNLKSLDIKRCKNLKLKPLSEWGLNKLTSLETFSIHGGYPGLVSFPGSGDDGVLGLLPPMLKSVSIGLLPNLKSLATFLQGLTALQHLRIDGCPKRQSLPKEALCNPLRSLAIYDCPLLEKRCLMDTGDYRPMLEYIPHVRTL